MFAIDEFCLPQEKGINLKSDPPKLQKVFFLAKKLFAYSEYEWPYNILHVVSMSGFLARPGEQFEGRRMDRIIRGYTPGVVFLESDSYHKKIILFYMLI